MAPVTPTEDFPDTPDFPGFGSLSIEPDFPIYALAPGFTARGWLMSWEPLIGSLRVPVDAENRPYKVTLGFGHHPPVPEVRVVTIANRAQVWSGGIGFGPTGVRDAALGAVLSALDIWNSYPHKRNRPPLSDQVQYWANVADDHEATEWHHKMVDVDGVAVSARFVTMGETDGVVIDLGEMAVAVVGNGQLLDDYGLIVVTDLGAYLSLGT